MNQIQTKVFKHLTESGHPDRVKALEDLVNRNIFDTWMKPEASTRIVRQYLADNPRGFCASGIGRFEKAVFGKAKRTARIVLDVELEGDTDNIGGIGVDGPTCQTIINAAVTRRFLSRKGHERTITKITAVSADWKD